MDASWGFYQLTEFMSWDDTNLKRLALWVKISADDILKYFSYFFQPTGFGISWKNFLEDNFHEMSKLFS